MGDTIVYNPWSIVNFMDEKIFKAYWVNSSSNNLVRDLIIQSSMDFKDAFELLLEDKTTERRIDENMVFGDLRQNESAIWSLLLMTGYLKVVSYSFDEEEALGCKLKIPNKEVGRLYRGIFQEWLADGKSSQWYSDFMNCLLNADMPAFEENLRELMEQTFSYHDFAHNPEAFYHGFFLGLTATLYGNHNYEIKSNKESGYGLYDYFIFSRDIKKHSILLEFKRVIPKDLRKLEMELDYAACEALQQVDIKNYLSEAKQQDAKHILKIGLAFSGKHFRLVYNNDTINPSSLQKTSN